jgi:predicted porin
MKNKLTAAIALASLTPFSAFADTTIFGKANVTVEAVSEGDADTTQIKSNASRLGFKGSEKVSDSLEAIYHIEYGVSIDDKSDTFSQRNIFAGLKGEFGTFVGGVMDTPFKSAQKKVDVFGDLEGDIGGMVTKSENRTGNSIAYATPSFSGFSAKAQVVMSEVDGGDDGMSLALAYEADKYYFAVAMDSDVEAVGYDATRVVAQVNLGPVQLGALFETTTDAADVDADGSFVSVKYKANDKWAIKAQYGQSDIVVEGGDTFSLGADYTLSKNASVFAFHTAEGADDDVVDNSYTGVGLIINF